MGLHLVNRFRINADLAAGGGFQVDNLSWLDGLWVHRLEVGINLLEILRSWHDSLVMSFDTDVELVRVAIFDGVLFETARAVARGQTVASQLGGGLLERLSETGGIC